MQASFENWALTVFRGGKCQAAALFCVRAEAFVIDDGATGNNGKTFLQAVMEQTFGGYAAQLKDTMLTQSPPNASSPDPALLMLKGSRGLGTPEVETTLKIRAAWLKKLADPSTQWAARAPHDRTDTLFKLFVIFFISTNCKIAFSKVDGGVVRRAISVPWAFHFCTAPREAHERPAHTEDIKGAAWLATKRAVISEYAEAAKFFIQEYLHSVNSAAEATTKSRLLRQLRSEPLLRNLSTEDLTQALGQVVVSMTSGGSRDRIRRIEEPRDWLAFNE